MPITAHDQAFGEKRLGRMENPHEDLSRTHDEIIGLERRLARSEDDVSVARLALSRRYAAFAADMVRRAGGDLRTMKTLTDRNNIVPLAGRGGGGPGVYD